MSPQYFELSPMDYYFFRPQMYTVQMAFEYAGTLDLLKLQAAFAESQRRLPVLSSEIEIKNLREIRLKTHPRILALEAFNLSATALAKQNADELFAPLSNAPGEALVKMRVHQSPTRAIVAFSFSHLLGDGFSFFLFLNTLVRSLRHLPEPQTISHARNLLYTPQASARPFNEEELYRVSGYVTPRPPNPIHCTEDRIFISTEELQALKREAQSRERRLSPNDVIMAYLLKRYYRDIPPGPDGQIIVRCPVDYRRTYSRASAQYFGNAVRDAVASFNPQTLPQLSLGEVAQEVRRAVSAVNEASVEASLRCLDSLRRERGIHAFAELGCPGLLVSNLSKLPFYEIDLGLGAPTQLHHASLNPRLAIVLPAENGAEIRFRRPRYQEHALRRRFSVVSESRS